MASGIYIHIPFCKKKCFYCDFYSVSNFDLKKEYLSALQKEIILQKKYFHGEQIATIYFGGGTPSLLTTEEILNILNSIQQNFEITSNAEITLEANPDDISLAVATDLIKTGINRISIGVQSFIDDDLKLLNRRHTAQQAKDSIAILKQVGFSNISADLIYGLPGMTAETWGKNLDVMFSQGVQHLSAYHLSIEAGTVFAHFLAKGKLNMPGEDQSIQQFQMLIHKAKQNKFIHYEISNFALADFYSKHNSAYWQQKKYLGIGSSAHSFNGNTRQWNVSNLNEYITVIQTGKIPCTIESLSDADKFNEYVMTALRTQSGIDIIYLKEHFNICHCEELIKKAKTYEVSAHLILSENNIILTDTGLLISDKIISDLFIDT